MVVLITFCYLASIAIPDLNILSIFFIYMGYQQSSFPSPNSLEQRLPLPSLSQSFVASSRETIANILQGKDPRKLLIIGPCSIHDLHACKDFAKHLLLWQKQLGKHFFFVMRCYVEKARSTTGWKGFVYDPFLDGSNEMEKGLFLAREFFLELLEMRLPLSMELVDPMITPYFSDLLSWGAIGARTCSSQPHRQLASSLPFPIGFKNNLDGDILHPIHGMIATATPHTFLSPDRQGEVRKVHTGGNPSGHLILRGSTSAPNYQLASVQSALNSLQSHGLSKRLLIDCAHDNSRKIPSKQAHVLLDSLDLIMEAGLEKSLLGFMLESHLFSGKQALLKNKKDLQYGVSITDPCLGVEETACLLEKACEQLEKEAYVHV